MGFSNTILIDGRFLAQLSRASANAAYGRNAAAAIGLASTKMQERAERHTSLSLIHGLLRRPGFRYQCQPITSATTQQAARYHCRDALIDADDNYFTCRTPIGHGRPPSFFAAY